MKNVGGNGVEAPGVEPGHAQSANPLRVAVFPPTCGDRGGLIDPRRSTPFRRVPSYSARSRQPDGNHDRRAEATLVLAVRR
jgi:hypothetical protein